MAAADFSLDGGQAYRHIHKTGMGDSESGLVEPIEAVISGAARAALDMRAGLVVILTTTGQSAYLLARYRLGLPILVMSQSEDVGIASSLHIACGLHVLHVSGDVRYTHISAVCQETDQVKSCIRHAASPAWIVYLFGVSEDYALH